MNLSLHTSPTKPLQPCRCGMAAYGLRAGFARQDEGFIPD